MEMEQNMGHEFLLSICMMVKDEEKNLRRCLDAMRSILDKGDTELIIVDTGSKDATADIAHEYTDKVFFHPWNDNFSEMRNITISYAKGRYILIIDADEVLNDALLLHKYLSDEGLSSYNTFIIKIKNLDSSGGYTVLPQERIFINDGSFRYRGSVHNQPVFKKPIANTDIYITHYGYLFHDKELRERKFIRTAGILQKELKKEPDNIYYRFQLARSYSAHHDKKEALDEIRKAYHFISRDKETRRNHAYIYGSYCIISAENNEYEEAIRICKEGLEVKEEYLDLYYVMAAAYVTIGRREEAQAAYIKYIELVSQYDKLSISADRAVEMCYTGEKYQDAANAYLANAFYNKDSYDECYKHAMLIYDENTRAINSVKALLKLKRYDEIKSLYTASLKNKNMRESIEMLIEAEMSGMNDENKEKIQTVFSDGDGTYFILNRIRICDGDVRLRLTTEALKQVDFCDLPDYYADMLIDIDKISRPILSILKKLRKSKIKQYIIRMIGKAEGLESFFEQYLLCEAIRADDYNSLKVYICIAYAVLLRKAAVARDAGIEPSELYHGIFRQYTENGLNYTKTLYSNERLRLYYSTLEDQEDTFFISLNYAEESCARGDQRAGIRYFREAARANAYLACYMKKYKDVLFKDTELSDEVENDG